MLLSNPTSFFWGVSAAIFAPFLMVLGFMIWDDHWTKKNGSAFSLNMFKCNLTAFWFFIVIVVSTIANEPLSLRGSSLTESVETICSKLNPFRNEDVKFLMASSTVGILIGDWTWIEGLKYLGARKVIVMDSLKPFLAALVGWAFFDEKFNNPWKASMGLVLTVVGVALVGLEVETDGKEEHEENTSGLEDDDHIESIVPTSNATTGQSGKMDESYQYGLFMAVSNVVLHTLGATLTKEFGVEMTTWEINFVRFGFSGLCMLLLTLLLQTRDQILQKQPLIGSTTSSTQSYGSIPTTDDPTHNNSADKPKTPWYTLPKLSRASWLRVTLGVAFVSFMTP